MYLYHNLLHCHSNTMKPQWNPNYALNVNDSLMHYPEASTMWGIDGQVCFHRWLFADPVGPCWYITGPVGPLGSTNQNWLCARLLPMAVLIYPVVCVHSCRLLGTQHYCLCSNGSFCPPGACHPPPPPHPTPSHPPTPY